MGEEARSVPPVAAARRLAGRPPNGFTSRPLTRSIRKTEYSRSNAGSARRVHPNSQDQAPGGPIAVVGAVTREEGGAALGLRDARAVTPGTLRRGAGHQVVTRQAVGRRRAFVEHWS